MRLNLPFVAAIALTSVSAHGDALTDLRAALPQLAGTTAIHGSFEVTTTSTNSEEARPDSGKAVVGFEVTADGLRIHYPRPMVAQAAQEARGEAIDPDRQTPTRTGVEHIRPLHLAELVDAAAALNVMLENAQLLQAKPATYAGRTARLLLFKVTPKLSASATKHVKKLDTTLSVWLGDDGLPIAAERVIFVKASFLLISFENRETESWSYVRAGDRLLATRYEQTQKSDGFGQHTSSQTTEALRLEP